MQTTPTGYAASGRRERKDGVIDRLVVTLGLALEEIHHPGAARDGGYDITAMIEGVIKEATRKNGVPQMIRDEMRRRQAACAL